MTKELLQQALDALNAAVKAFGKICPSSSYGNDVSDMCDAAAMALEKALAQPVPQIDRFLGMVRVWVERDGGDMDAALTWMYKEPTQRPWVGLTETEANRIWQTTDDSDSWEMLKRVEAKLKEKNHESTN